MKKLGLLLICASAMTVGCATQKYGYRPSGAVPSAEAGYPASHYKVPPESPRGEVYVTSFGTRETDSGGGSGEQLLHVRLAVANHNADTEWTVDPGKQLLSAPNASPQKPDFMEVDGKHDGNTTVTAGQKRVFDFYYRMPAGVKDASQVGAFELLWQLDGGGQTFAQRTSFTREPFRDYADAPRSRVAVGVAVAPWWAYGYGPGWWGGFGFGYYGPWGYPYYGYGPYVGYGHRYGGYYGHRGFYGGGGGYRGGGWGGGGGFRGGGGGGGGIRGPVTRGRP